MQKRIQYLDIIKVISIFLVVFCHFVLLSETVPANILMVACWSGVPMFFMVNGALLFTRPLKLEKHIRKTILIYIVLVAWRLIYLFTVGPLAKFLRWALAGTRFLPIFSPLTAWTVSERAICGLLKPCWRFILYSPCSASPGIIRQEEKSYSFLPLSAF